MDQRREEAAQLWQIACNVINSETTAELQQLQVSVQPPAARFICNAGGCRQLWANDGLQIEVAAPLGSS
jgi:hypothetical protein